MLLIKQKNDEIIFKGHTLPRFCAAASSIMYTTVNALIKYENIRNRDDVFTYEDNVDADFVSIKILKHDEIIDLLIENMFEMLNDVREETPETIKIIRNKKA